MEKSNIPNVAGRLDVPWDLRGVPLGKLDDSAEARQLVTALLVRAVAPAEELVVVAGFNNTI